MINFIEELLPSERMDLLKKLNIHFNQKSLEKKNMVKVEKNCLHAHTYNDDLKKLEYTITNFEVFRSSHVESPIHVYVKDQKILYDFMLEVFGNRYKRAYFAYWKKLRDDFLSKRATPYDECLNIEKFKEDEEEY